MYSVNYWESHPDCDNDDCSMGFDFDNKDEALAKYHETPSALTAYVEITGPDVHEIRQNPNYRTEPDDYDDWHREQRMQAAMAFGVLGWNDWS